MTAFSFVFGFCRTRIRATLTLLAGLLYCATLLAESRQILVIESYHAEYPWDQSYLAGLRDKLPGYRIHTFEMDTKRLPKSEFDTQAEKAWRRFEEIRPELVVLGDDNAVKYLGPRLQSSGIPVVFLGVNSNPRTLGVMHANNMTGVLERPLFKRSVAELASLFQKPLKKILVLFDSGTTSHAAVAEAFQGNTRLNIGHTLVELQLIGNLELWQATIKDSQQDGYDAIIIGLYHTLTDQNGAHVNSETLLTWTSQNTPTPLFSFWDFSVGPDKTAGGLVLFGRGQGEEAAQLVIEILENGVTPGSISPKIADRGRYLYSRSQLAKWGLSLDETSRRRAEFVD